MKLKILIWNLLTSYLLISCGTSTKIEAIKPEAETANNIVFTTKVSYVGMPVTMEIADIQKVLNQNINNLIYTDSILDDNNMEMKIWKTNTISLSQENEKIKIVMPIKIWLKYKYGTDFMGLNDSREFNLNGKVTVLSDISLSNWQLKIKSKIEKIEWNESPTIKIANKNVSITYLINPALSWFKEDIAQQLDEAIGKSCDFKPQVIDALKTLATPYLINEKFETWLSINPLEIYATDATITKGNVLMDLGMKTTIKTVIGDKPTEKMNWNTLKMIKVKNIPNNFTGSVAAITSFKSASRIITTNFKGQTFTSGSKKITIDNVDMWQKDNKIIIALTMNGSLNGTIYLSGKPKFDSTTQEIYFEDLAYVLNTKNVLHKSASWLLNGMILKKINENCRYSITDDINFGRENIMPFFNNYSPIKGVYINGSLGTLKFEKFDLLNNAIVSFINASGNISVKIDGLE